MHGEDDAVPTHEGLYPIRAQSDVRLSGFSGAEGFPQGDEFHRPPGTGSWAGPSGDGERGPEGLDLGSDDRDGPSVRRFVPGGNGVGRSDDGKNRGGEVHDAEPPEALGEIVATNAGQALINARVGQAPAPLGDEFEIGAHYLDLFEYEHERRQAVRLGAVFDVRALEAAHGRADGLGNPDVIVRASGTDLGAYGDLKRLDPDLKPDRKDADFSRRVEKRLREPFGQDARITVAVVDGREIGLTIDAAVRGIRRALGFWRQQGREVLPEQRMIVFTGDGGSVVWRGDTGEINVSA